MIIKDKIAGKEWLQYKCVEDLGEDAPNQFNLDDFLVGSSEGQLRLVRKDGMLVKIANGEPKDVYNYVNSLLPAEKKLDDSGIEKNALSLIASSGHALIRMKCGNCAEGAEYDKVHDLGGSALGGVNVADVLSNISVGGIAGSIFRKEANFGDSTELLLPLNDFQASKVYNSIVDIVEKNKVGAYVYVSKIHNCVSFLDHVYQGAKFDGSFVNYFTDEELFQGTAGYVLFSTILKQQAVKFPVPFDNLRKEITKFMKSIYGDGFKEMWDKIESDTVDEAAASNYPAVLQRIDEIKTFRGDTTAKHLDNYLKIWDLNLTPKAYEVVSETLLSGDKKITNYDLYYYYTFAFEVLAQEKFMDTPYSKLINDEHINLIAPITVINDGYVNTFTHQQEVICSVPEYAAICEEGRFDNTAARDLEQKCYVIDEHMIAVCPLVEFF